MRADEIFTPGMQWTSTVHAGPERYAPTAFDSQVGAIVPLRVLDEPTGYVRIVAAVVADDGMSVQLTYEYIGTSLEER